MVPCKSNSRLKKIGSRSVLAPKYPNHGLMQMELPTGRETSVERALETCFVAGRFATVWALRLKGLCMHDESIVGGLHKEQSTCLGNCLLSSRPLAERIFGWICHKFDILRFYRLFSGSELLPYGAE